ncbi:ribonuclease domain-containing protein [Streptomyces pseudogriseolus]|uniref:ribonuclease domain-containing protein n=1 Tax=Streptomyces pseudogriseolus TaxID=36817 RepID=UPI003FA32617
MRFPPRAARSGAATALLSVLLLGGGGMLSAPAAHAAPALPVAATAAPSVLAVGEICYGDLPSEAHDTLDLIDQGGPFPFEQDGTVFQNREGILPGRSTGYYHEYTVITPGSPTRGARRIVTGEEYQEDYYTADHYASFDLVDHSC